MVRRASDGTIADAIPSGFNARTRVHEYGGGAYTVRAGVLIFANFADTRLYRVDGNDAPRPITPKARCATPTDLRSEPRAAHRRTRGPFGDGEAVQYHRRARPERRRERRYDPHLRCGLLFQSRLSPDGQRLAWLQWNHPNMPWDGSELWVGEIGEDGMVSSSELLAGSPQESIFQPEWASDGTLYFVSDRTGWWNLYRRSGAGDEAVAPMEAEFGLPQWVFGMATYAFPRPADGILPPHPLLTLQMASSDHRHQKSAAVSPIEAPFTEIDDPFAADGVAVLVGGVRPCRRQSCAMTRPVGNSRRSSDRSRPRSTRAICRYRRRSSSQPRMALRRTASSTTAEQGLRRAGG